MKNRRVDGVLRVTAAIAIGQLLIACSAPPPAGSPTGPAASPSPADQPVPAAPPAEVTASRPALVTPTVRLAPRDPALDQWKRAAAERIHTINRAQTFEGRPHHLLKAVIVVEVAVDRSGQLMRSKVLRSPGIKSLDQVALASLKAASPFPPPPSALVAKGPLVFSETWLFQNDGRFQVRTLALAQE